jgi:tetratricopeptide (TPR) repeat protein
LRRFEVALMGLEWVERKLLDREWPLDLVAIAHSTSASVHYAVKDYAKAKEGFQRALALFDELDNALERCRARINLGQTLSDLGRHRSAIHYLTAGTDEAIAHQFDRLTAIGLSHLAAVYFKEDRLAACERHAIQSNTYARSLDHKPTLFRNCYYLWKLAGVRMDEPGVAANAKSLKALQHRVPRDMPEVDAFFHSKERGDR